MHQSNNKHMLLAILAREQDEPGGHAQKSLELIGFGRP
jgi:hypothetical protein